MRIADVYINIPIKSISQAFSYLVPEDMHQLTAGWRVLVPFGGRDIEGFVVDACLVSEYNEEERGCPLSKLKPLKALVDEEPWFSPLLIQASRWLARFYLCSPGEIMRLFMPGKSGLRIRTQYEAVSDVEDNMLLLVDAYRKVYDLLSESGAMGIRQLSSSLSERDEEESAARLGQILSVLTRHGLIKKVYDAGLRGKEAVENYLVLPMPLTEGLADSIEKRKRGQMQLARWLLRQSPPKEAYSFKELEKAGFSKGVIKAFGDSSLAQVEKRRVLRDSYKTFEARDKILQLTEDQQRAVREISHQLAENKYAVYLLYGVTGSGKTQVYIESAKKARAAGRLVIVLVPEIALTGQVVQEFKAYFAQDIVVMHSRLSVNERNDAIMRVRTGRAGVIIGARSALFTPADNVGLIIMDEEQDNSYKQDEAPRYHARVVAEKLAELHEAVLVLGSATPSIETYYHAIRGDYGLLRLPKRIGSRPMPKIVCADMRQELKNGRKSVISRKLQWLIQDTLQKKEQLILMLNRRGFATFVMCRSCGEAIKCPQCTMPLVYHRDGRLLCHHCDIYLPVPDVCPRCASPYIKYFGSGTEKLEQELSLLVPEARIIRMDRDTTTRKFAHTEILEKFRRGEYDILLGTQMVAKGHDIPNVTAVGILSADSTLNMPDFRAAERVFMLITQTAGRSGRGNTPGRVVVQCYNPEHFAVQTGIRQDYEKFFQEEMQLRKAMFNPPYSRLIKLTFLGKSQLEAVQMARSLQQEFADCFRGNSMHQAVGPAPAMMACLRGIYRFVLLLKTADIDAVLHFLRERKIADNMQVVVDIDPVSTS